MISKHKSVLFTATAILFISVFLHFHNALMYMPDHGFDGAGHVYYAQYIAQHGKLPDPKRFIFTTPCCTCPIMDLTERGMCIMPST